jgi:murein DD-endopeptidase MepM/ murein hydrolase activator NlpD
LASSDSTSTTDNSQTIALLQANTSPLSPSSDSTGSDSNSDVNIVSDSALLPSVGLQSASSSSNFSGGSTENVSVYVVRQGDTLSQIASMFGVSVNTILWANDMNKSDTIGPGDVLFILPVSGIEHTITKGQTISSIAKMYNADINDIVLYNGLAQDTILTPGNKLIIPNGEKSSEGNTPVQNLSQTIAQNKQYYINNPTKNLSGYYVDPVPGYILSQGIHANNGVDLAIASGTPIHAAASGSVILARYGYNGGYGNVVIIDHPNGTETLYAHQSKIAVQTGNQVSQGQVIGYVGCTGLCTGPHLHFEVHGARNPGADDSWKQ